MNQPSLLREHGAARRDGDGPGEGKVALVHLTRSSEEFVRLALRKLAFPQSRPEWGGQTIARRLTACQTAQPTPGQLLPTPHVWLFTYGFPMASGPVFCFQ